MKDADDVTLKDHITWLWRITSWTQNPKPWTVNSNTRDTYTCLVCVSYVYRMCMCIVCVCVSYVYVYLMCIALSLSRSLALSRACSRSLSLSLARLSLCWAPWVPPQPTSDCWPWGRGTGEYCWAWLNQCPWLGDLKNKQSTHTEQMTVTEPKADNEGARCVWRDA